MNKINKADSFHLLKTGLLPAIIAVILLSLFPALALAQDKENSDSFATVNGENIWYKIIGKGEPLVLIAGGPGSSHCVFLPWFDDLPGHFKVIYFDALGRGKSSRAKNKA